MFIDREMSMHTSFMLKENTVQICCHRNDKCGKFYSDASTMVVYWDRTRAYSWLIKVNYRNTVLSKRCKEKHGMFQVTACENKSYL